MKNSAEFSQCLFFQKVEKFAFIQYVLRCNILIFTSHAKHFNIQWNMESCSGKRCSCVWFERYVLNIWIFYGFSRKHILFIKYFRKRVNVFFRKKKIHCWIHKRNNEKRSNSTKRLVLKHYSRWTFSLKNYIEFRETKIGCEKTFVNWITNGETWYNLLENVSTFSV